MRKSAFRPSISAAFSGKREAGIGTTAEKSFAKRVGGRLTPGSGALRQKSDGEILHTSVAYRFENKATEKASLSLKLEWLEKISREATAREQVPLLSFQFVDGGNVRPFGSWVAMPESEFNRLVNGEGRDE